MSCDVPLMQCFVGVRITIPIVHLSMFSSGQNYDHFSFFFNLAILIGFFFFYLIEICKKFVSWFTALQA